MSPVVLPDEYKPARPRGIQLRIRLSHAAGHTPKHVLRKPLRFPVVLGDEFTVTEDATFEDFLTIGAGELSSPMLGRGAQMLESFGSETMTCTWNPAWMTYPGQHPGEVEDALTQVLRSRKPFHLLALLAPTGHRPEFAGLATMRSRSKTLKHGEPDARYYAFDFRRYREVGVERRRHGGGSGGGHRDLPTKHALKPEDTLESLARAYYGKPNLWKWIGRANGIRKWGPRDLLVTFARLHVGDELVIPKPPRTENDIPGTPEWGENVVGL